MVEQIAAWVGDKVLTLCENTGLFTLFLLQALRSLFSYRLKVHKTFVQMRRIGVDSMPIVILTGSFTGMVFALQSYIGFKRVGGEQFIGAVVALGMIRELGPVLSGLMVTGRASSAIAAEIGTMQITEQIDALKTLRINIYQYLIIPRILAGFIILPFLTIFAMFCGIIGGYAVCVYILQLNGDEYITNVRMYVEMFDIVQGLMKAAVFGLILTWVGAYKGYHTRGGAYGVGIATTQSVVMSSMMILIANYFLTKFLEQL